MIGYKIYYKDDNNKWCDYDKSIYIDETKAIEVMEDIKEQFPDKTWKIYEVTIDY